MSVPTCKELAPQSYLFELERQKHKESLAGRVTDLVDAKQLLYENPMVALRSPTELR
jgi:hypothetical protein